MTRNKLFVFGSFAPGMVHFGKIEAYVLESRDAFVRGNVYRLPSGVPVLSGDGMQAISGLVVTLKNHEILLALLDEFHGVHRADPEKSLFFRETVQVFYEEGGAEPVDAFVINPQRMPRGTRLVEDGDWRKSLEEKPPLLVRLSERQRNYIQKLGASSSRDIVPIDLNLYRELMHLEIVIDKGRRLALTSLGQELYRFLS